MWDWHSMSSSETPWPSTLLGGAYTMLVDKGWIITQIGGDECDRFIARLRLSGGELISFSFRGERPRISVIYLNLISDSEDEVHEEDDGEDSDDDENPLDEALYAQRLRLKRATSGTCFRHVNTTLGCHSWPASQVPWLIGISWYVAFTVVIWWYALLLYLV